MTFHLTNIREKIKKETNWKSAEHKYKSIQLQKEWVDLQKKYESKKPLTIKAGSIGTKYSLSPPPGRNRNSHIPSIPDTISVAPKKEVMQYSGSAIKGVSTMHKSNAVPVFSDDEIKDHANMRR